MTVRKSPWISFYNTGGCNGCTLECVACATPKYDIERFGCLFKASAKHCDVLVVTGPVTKQSRARLMQVYDQMNKPKKVIAVGACAVTGGLFRNNYSVEEPLDKYIPVDAYVPGCPPRPQAIMDGILKVLNK